MKVYSTKEEEEEKKDNDEDDIILDDIINNKDNSLTKKDKLLLKKLYVNVSRDIKKSIASQDLDDLDLTFWLNILSIAMTVVEHLSDDGNKKQDLVIEVVALVLKEELIVENEIQKRKIIISFRKFAPKAIEMIVFMSKQLNIDKIAAKCCPCF